MSSYSLFYLILTSLVSSVFLEELNYAMNNIFDDAVKSGEAINLHDILFKFTLDSFVK